MTESKGCPTAEPNADDKVARPPRSEGEPAGGPDPVGSQKLPAVGPLARHLTILTQRSNKFQVHAQASLRVLERVRRRAALEAQAVQGLDDACPCSVKACASREGSRDSTDDGSSAASLGSSYSSAASLEDVQANTSFSNVCNSGKTVSQQSGPDLKPIKEAHSNPVLSKSAKSERMAQTFYGKSLDVWPPEVIALLASVKAKGGDQLPEPATDGLRLKAGAAQIPHPRKAKLGGEDSFFICPDGSAVGVADGVGEWGWRFKINPRAFADELMVGARRSAKRTSGNDDISASQRAAMMLVAGYESVTCFGSATALVVGLDTTGSSLGAANLGDSGMRHVRFGHCGRAGSPVTIVNRTKEQQHMFNCPYQLTRLPQAADFAKLLADGKDALVHAVENMRPASQDQPEHADLYTCRLQEGDLVILGTDGLFDNIHDEEICQLLSSVVPPSAAGYVHDVADKYQAGTPLGNAASPLRKLPMSAPGGGGPPQAGRDFTDPGVIASALAMAAFHRSKDRSARTPFTLHAKEAGLYHVGGKMDDITVVAAWVVRTPESSDPSGRS